MTDEEKLFDRYVDYVLIPTVVQVSKFENNTRSGVYENESQRDRRIRKEATEVDFIDVTDEPDEGVQTGQISGT